MSRPVGASFALIWICSVLGQPILDGMTEIDHGFWLGLHVTSEQPKLMLNLILSRQYTWVVIGVLEANGSPIYGDVQEMALIIIEETPDAKTKLHLRTCRTTAQMELTLDDHVTYHWESKLRSADSYTFSISRPLDSLKVNKKCKVIYALGSEATSSEISDVFKDRAKVREVLADIAEPAQSSAAVPTSVPRIERTTGAVDEENDEHQESVKPLPTSSTTRSTIQVQWIAERIDPTKASQDPTSATGTPESPVVPVTKKKGVSLCPESRESELHWWDKFHAKENTVYFAIIGSAALATGLLVLCIACCCARQSAQPIKVRASKRSKVAFYKVSDDLDSDNDEEVEFLGEKPFKDKA